MTTEDRAAVMNDEQLAEIEARYTCPPAHEPPEEDADVHALVAEVRRLRALSALPSGGADAIEPDSAGLYHNRIAPASGRLLRSRPIGEPEPSGGAEDRERAAFLAGWRMSQEANGYTVESAYTAWLATQQQEPTSGGAEGPTREQVAALTPPDGTYHGFYHAGYDECRDAVLALYAEPTKGDK